VSFVFFVVIPPLTFPEQLEGFFTTKNTKGTKKGFFRGGT